MLSQDGLVHTKRERKKGKGSKGGNGLSGPKGYSSEQSDGRFSFDTIHGMKLKEVEYRVPKMAERKARRAEFQGQNGTDGVRARFLIMLATKHAQELKNQLGMTDEDIARMAEGKSINGYNVHHKLPIHGGGKNEFSNFILTPLYPHDQWHHDVLDPQIANIGEGSRKVMLPWTDEMIYDPKKYGFTKDNQKVEPNYHSRVDATKYPKIYKPEHVADIAARKRELDQFAPVQNDNNRGGKRGKEFASLAKQYSR